MRKFAFKKIDAFTGENAAGNPAGCIYLKPDDEIPAAAMQKIAKELQGFVNEVAFLFPAEDGVRVFGMKVPLVPNGRQIREAAVSAVDMVTSLPDRF